MAKKSDKQETRYRWKPGQSGNPNGRPPKERTLVTHIERYLVMTQEHLKAEAAKTNLTIAQYLAVKYLLDCAAHPTHTDKLMDRLYGVAISHIDLNNQGSINVKFSLAKELSDEELANIASRSSPRITQSQTSAESSTALLPIHDAELRNGIASDAGSEKT